MSTALVPVAPAPSDSTAIAPAVNRAEAYARAAKAPATRKAYASDWAHFQAWCDEMGLSSLPVGPQTVAVYIAALAESHKPATISRRMAAIEAAHKAVGLESPASMRNGAVASVWHGIRRTHGVAQDAKAPVLVDELRGMVRNLRRGVIGIRDRALLLVGFAGAFRRSELVALDFADLRFTSDGLVITLRRSKVDQEGEGRKLGIPYGSNPDTCPVRSLKAWLEAAGIDQAGSNPGIRCRRDEALGETRPCRPRDLRPHAVDGGGSQHARRLREIHGDIAGHEANSGGGKCTTVVGFPDESIEFPRAARRARRCRPSGLWGDRGGRRGRVHAV